MAPCSLVMARAAEQAVSTDGAFRSHHSDTSPNADARRVRALGANSWEGPAHDLTRPLSAGKSRRSECSAYSGYARRDQCTRRSQDVVLVSPTDVQPERERAEPGHQRAQPRCRRAPWNHDAPVALGDACAPGPGSRRFPGPDRQGAEDPGRRLVIGIFWKRFGTPVEDADSGSESELRSAWDSWLRAAHPSDALFL